MFWPNSDDVHRADAICICDVVGVVGVDAVAIEVPCDMWCGKATDSAGHVQLISLWWTVDFKRNQDGRRPLKSYRNR